MPAALRAPELVAAAPAAAVGPPTPLPPPPPFPLAPPTPTPPAPPTPTPPAVSAPMDAIVEFLRTGGPEGVVVRPEVHMRELSWLSKRLLLLLVAPAPSLALLLPLLGVGEARCSDRDSAALLPPAPPPPLVAGATASGDDAVVVVVLAIAGAPLWFGEGGGCDGIRFGLRCGCNVLSGPVIVTHFELGEELRVFAALPLPAMLPLALLGGVE